MLTLSLLISRYPLTQILKDVKLESDTKPSVRIEPNVTTICKVLEHLRQAHGVGRYDIRLDVPEWGKLPVANPTTISERQKKGMRVE